MRKNLVTWLGIEEIIEDSLIADIPFCFVCNEELACSIVEHIEHEYGIIDECDELFESDEYYVAVLPSTNKIPAQLFCESARGTLGAYKLNDVENMQFYIFSDMPLKDAREKLYGDRFGFFEWITNEECECDEDYCECNWENDSCDCECCDEDTLTDEDFAIGKLLCEYTNKIIEVSPCPECVFDTLQELALKFREIGFKDSQDLIRSFIDNIDDLD